MSKGKKKSLDNLDPSNKAGKPSKKKWEIERAYFMWLRGDTDKQIREVMDVHDHTFRKYAQVVFPQRAKEEFLKAGTISATVDEEDIERKDRVLLTLRKEIDSILNDLENWDEIEEMFLEVMENIRKLNANSEDKLDRPALMTMVKSVSAYLNVRKGRQDLRTQLQSLIKTWKENSRIELAEMTEKESAKTMAKSFAVEQAENLISGNSKNKQRTGSSNIKKLGGGLFDDE